MKTPTHTSTLVVIPARLAATRLPRKPLADICGIPMVVRVMQQAMVARLGAVIVACCSREVADVVERAGGTAILTDPSLPSGTDRTWAAVQTFDPSGQYTTIVNVQGDVPTISSNALQKITEPFTHPDVGITTLGAPLSPSSDQVHNPNVVKVACGAWQDTPSGLQTARCVYFSRMAIPTQAPTYYAHIGVYGYRRNMLQQFVETPVSYLEKTEKLEQLRALEMGIRIDMVQTRELPPSVDTPEDLAYVRTLV